MSDNKLKFTVCIDDISMSFATSPALFSPKGADKGTLAMLVEAKPYLVPEARVMDMGCAWGLVGVYASRLCGGENVTMSDISAEAVALSRENLADNGISPLPQVIESDCFKFIDAAGFDVILINPPYHTDFSVPKEMIEKGFNRLKIGGRLFMVTKRLDWYKNKLTTIFGGVKISETEGYYIFNAQRRQAARGGGKSRNR